MSAVSTGTLRLISQDLLDELINAFKAPDITAASTEADVKWAAAQHQVVQWIVAKANAKQSVVQPVPKPGSMQYTGSGAFVRIGT